MAEFLHHDEVSLVASILGGFIILFGLVSFFVKERLYLSEALVSVIVGIILGPIALGILNPSRWGQVDEVTYGLTRVVIAIQVMCSGVALPRAYLVKEWRTLLMLDLPVMTYMWAVSGLLIRWLIPKMNFLQALAIAACVTPTDPILANSVVKGRFAEKHVPPHVRNLLSAESASNDGLAYPFLFLAIYILEEPSISTAMGKWFLIACLYEVALSCVIGIVVGYIARKLLYIAESKRLIDKESFLVFAIALALFMMGAVSMIGSNELLSCFIAGTSFTWDDWFRKETEEAHLQEVIDMLLNLAIFMYVGATIPWLDFHNAVTEITVWRLVVCAILILIFRRLPIILALMKFMPALKTYREAAFTGWFGPIGISAIYYVSVIKRRYQSDSANPLYQAVGPVVYFLVLSSILVHGITIPLVKISRRINTRTLTTGTLNNQVSRLPVIRIGTDLIFRPKTDKEKNPPPPEGLYGATTAVEIESQAEAQIDESDNNLSTRNKEKQREEEDRKRHYHDLNIDIPPNLIEKCKIRQTDDKSSRLSSKYAIWDEGDSYIIENYDGEDIHVITSSHSSSSTQEQGSRSYFFRKITGSSESSQEHDRREFFRNLYRSGGSPSNSSPQAEQSRNAEIPADEPTTDEPTTEEPITEESTTEESTINKESKESKN